MIEFSCSQCAAAFDAPEKGAGGTGRCPQCGTEIKDLYDALRNDRRAGEADGRSSRGLEAVAKVEQR